MRKMIDFICEECKVVFKSREYERKFCSSSCFGKNYNRNRKPHSQEVKDKISKSLKNYKASPEHRKKISESLKEYYRFNRHNNKDHYIAVGNSTRGKFRDICPESILTLSSRTVSKILKRLNVGCSRCGWNEAACDIHHIMGKKIENSDSHDNLTYLCPNCHRLAHSHKIKPDEMITLTEYIGDRWKEFYYG